MTYLVVHYYSLHDACVNSRSAWIWCDGDEGVDCIFHADTWHDPRNPQDVDVFGPVAYFQVPHTHVNSGSRCVNILIRNRDWSYKTEQ